MTRVPYLLVAFFAGGLAMLAVADQAAPKSVQEKLLVPIDVNFRRTPMFEAVTAITKKAGVGVQFDREALKSVGYTLNMPIDLKATATPAADVLQQIRDRFPQLRFFVDQEQGAVKVTAVAAF